MKRESLIRRCNTCQKVTAIDLDNTLGHKREMQMLGQTVYEVSHAEAMEMWKAAGKCRCTTPERTSEVSVAPTA